MRPECQKKENGAAENALGVQMWEEESVLMALTPPFRFGATDGGTSREKRHSSCTSRADAGAETPGPTPPKAAGPLAAAARLALLGGA